MDKIGWGKQKAEKKEVKDAEESNPKIKKAAAIVIVIALAAALTGIFTFARHMGKKITVVTTVGNVTFTDKHREDGKCYVTFKAADYNVIPAELNQKGMTVLIEEDLYKALPLEVEYDSVNVVFEVPRFAYAKAGFSQKQANVQTLWTEEILSKYARIQSLVWSMKY